MSQRDPKGTEILFADLGAAGDLERAKESLAGAQLLSAPQELCLEVELARQVDFPFREMPGSRERLISYSIEFCPSPAIVRLSAIESPSSQYVRLESFRRVAGKWFDCGHSLFEISAARHLAAAILLVKPVPTEPSNLQ